MASKCIVKDCNNSSDHGLMTAHGLCGPCFNLIHQLPAKAILTKVRKLHCEAEGLMHSIMHAAIAEDFKTK